MSLLIKGADLLGTGRQDLLISGGVITEIGRLSGAAAGSGTETIDADGLVALPGLVDLHTHLREPGREDAETIASGSAAAAGRSGRRTTRRRRHQGTRGRGACRARADGSLAGTGPGLLR